MAPVSVTRKSRPNPLKPGLSKRSASKRPSSVGLPHASNQGNHRRPPLGVVPGRFGPWGGRYVPETLMAACEELEREYEKAKRDPRYKARLAELLKSFAGRPTPLFYAR